MFVCGVDMAVTMPSLNLIDNINLLSLVSLHDCIVLWVNTQLNVSCKPLGRCMFILKEVYNVYPIKQKSYLRVTKNACNHFADLFYLLAYLNNLDIVLEQEFGYRS